MTNYARIVVATALAAGALIAATASAEGWDAGARKAAAGTYAVRCADPRAVHLVLDDTGLTARRGEDRIAARSVDIAYSYFGNSPPPGFVLAATGRLPRDRELVVLVFADRRGRYAMVAGDADTLAKLGEPVDSRTRFRDCDAARQDADGAAAAARDRQSRADAEAAARASPLADRRFAAAWRRALGTRANVDWLAHLDGPSRGAETVEVGGRRVTQIASCKPHDCYDNNVLVLYDPGSGTLVGALLETSRPMTLLGAPSPAMAAELGRRWRAEFRQNR